MTLHSSISLASLGVLAVLAGCGGSLRLSAATPMRATPIAEVQVVYGADLDQGKLDVLNDLEVAVHMQAALRSSFPVGNGPRMLVMITRYRTGRWGPTRMNADATLVGPDGTVQQTIPVSSTTIRGSNARSKTQRVAQDCVNQLVGSLP
ncbi:MAG: hypothetical protein AAGH15_12265 [Myxococcota bacterium]